MRNYLMKGIDEDNGDQEHAQDGVFQEQQIQQSILQKQRNQHHRGDDFHQEVMPMYPGSAELALTS